MRVSLVVHQDARMRMEGFGAVREHAGTLGGQRVEGIRFRGRWPVASGQLQIKAAKGHADGPGEQGGVVGGQWSAGGRGFSG